VNFEYGHRAGFADVDFHWQNGQSWRYDQPIYVGGNGDSRCRTALYLAGKLDKVVGQS